MIERYTVFEVPQLRKEAATYTVIRKKEGMTRCHHFPSTQKAYC